MAARCPRNPGRFREELELIPLQSRIAVLNEWIGEEVIRFSPLNLASRAT